MTEQERTSIELLEQRIGYVFRNKDLVFEALTHSSYAYERKIHKVHSNERLEFLGDAVLEQISSVYIFHHCPDMPEGKMSRLRASMVCEGALATCAQRIGLGELIYLGRGEMAGGGREKPSVTSDAYEALIGAMYLDGGSEPARAFVEREVLSCMQEKLREADPKSLLQEKVQAGSREPIVYELISSEGPEHEKTFVVGVKVGGRLLGTGSGHNKKAAEKAAAAEALKVL